MAAETNVITSAEMQRVREVDFVQQFTHRNLNKLIEVLGVTRKIPLMEGTTMYMYTTSGTLQSGDVEEGDVIPLSKYEQTKTPIGEIALGKHRKAVTAESIIRSGINDAVVDTDMELLSDIQKDIRTKFFSLFKSGGFSTIVMEDGLQKALAKAWGNLQIKFEDDTAQAVYFINPTDMANYLGTANITMQTAFGMNYIENFLGLGTVIMTSQVQAGSFYATAKENIVMYYLTMGGDVANAFDLTTDETGYIGIKSGYQNEERAQIETLVMDGINFFIEYKDGVVQGAISNGA